MNKEIFNKKTNAFDIFAKKIPDVKKFIIFIIEDVKY